MIEKFESKVRITGIGQSQIGRRLGANPIGLAVDACLAAMADAGLERSEIDGLSCHPGPLTRDGYSGGGIADVERVLQVHPRWFNSGHEFAGHTGALVEAAMAVAAGLARHVIVWRCTWESSAQQRQTTNPHSSPSPEIAGDFQWMIPFGAFSAANWIAPYANLHMHRYGTTREQLGAIAINARANAAHNPAAIYRDPISMDDYLSARMISTPLGLYDCDVPCDGATAVIVSEAAAARDTRGHSVRIEACGTQLVERVSWDNGVLDQMPLARGAAQSMWQRTDLKPADVDVAELYDGFTFNCLSWLELLGFCAIGEGGAFVEGGKRIALDGELPLNTHGGQLSAGRLQGFGFLHEACVQLRGEGGARQVRDAQVAVVTTGGGAPGGALLLTRD